MPMVYVCYGGCVIGLLLLAGWREEPKSSKLQIGRFFGSFGYNSYVNRSIILCMYVDNTKCLRPPNQKSEHWQSHYDFLYTVSKKISYWVSLFYRNNH
jgi:hypothetical protein